MYSTEAKREGQLCLHMDGKVLCHAAGDVLPHVPDLLLCSPLLVSGWMEVPAQLTVIFFTSK
jgi:hypothetical protein